MSATCRLATLLCVYLTVTPVPVCGQTASAFVTPVVREDLDPGAFTQWVGGREWPVEVADGQAAVLWTQTTAPHWDGVRFGDTRVSGRRHMRIGFSRTVAIGAVLVRGGGELSVLKPGVAYPGSIADERQWSAAQRIRGRTVGMPDVGEEDYAVWVLPPGTKTRALRFTHVAAPTENRYGGWLGGAFVLCDRFADQAGQARAGASANPDVADRLNDGSNNGTWSTWDNGLEGAVDPVSPQRPVYVTLTWPRPVSLRGLCALWAGFDRAEAQAWTGAAGRDPTDTRSSQPGDWRTIRSFEGIDNQYPRALGVNWLDFGQTVATRAIRLRITSPTGEGHPHLTGKTMGGRRVWLGELIALSPLASADLKTALLPAAQAVAAPHPPLPIRFSLPAAGYVTLVIEETRTGRRVRNLVSEMPFPAGSNTAWWDGLDDLGRDAEAARHGVYQIPARLVSPGTYRVRGLWRKAVHLRYEFSVYNAGHPAWETADGTGGWLTNHTPPQAACFLPADRAPGGKALMYLGSFVAEGGSGLAWTDMQGRKVGGRGWIGGNWTAAPFLCRDGGPERVKGDTLYVGAPWHVGEDNQKPGVAAELRITALTPDGDRQVVKYEFQPTLGPRASGDNRWISQMGGIAAHNGLIVVSLTRKNEILLVDARTGKVGATGGGEIVSPRGLTFDREGRLLVLCGPRLLRITLPEASTLAEPHPPPVTMIADGLEDPYGVLVDAQGRIYITDRGASHQVKVFSKDGKLVRTIGHPGAPKAGRYDPLHMNSPAGLDVDAEGRVWVTEADYSPKRVSVWSADGRLLDAFYGPGQYGGGGTLDPTDPARFYYSGVEFRLDWKTGRNAPINVFFRPAPGEMPLPDGFGTTGGPETPLYFRGRKYMTNCYTSNPTNGASIATLWIVPNGVAHPVVALGRAYDWGLLKTEPFRERWPKGVDPNGDYQQNPALFAWSDLNANGRAEANEVTMVRASSGGVVVNADLSIAVSRVSMSGGAPDSAKAMLYRPVRFTPQGVPVYELLKAETLAVGAQSPTTSGGDQALVCPDGWTVLTVAPKPFAAEGLGGVYHDKSLWSYPSLWPGLHASHESPPPDRPGELIGTTRLLGPPVTPKRGAAGPLWCVNGNMGSMYLFTSDGLFVATLFRDIRQGRSWSMPAATRGMLLDDVSPHDENFWPSISQTPDGNVYLVDGGRTSLVRVDGLDSIRRMPATELRVTAADVERARVWQADAEAARQRAQGRASVRVALLTSTPGLDGWPGADWAQIDKRGVAAWFDSNSKPYDVEAALAVSGGKLHVLYRTGEPNLLRNSGDTPLAPFKTGGALDLMLGADPSASATRRSPAPGDLRLLVTQVNGKTRAVLYRPSAPGTAPDRRTPFSSPSRTILFDRVDDVSDRVELSMDGKGAYLVAVPLELLGLKPTAGMSIRGDVGILRGNGFQTLQRVYWRNKATGITADVPSEAELTPQLWGLFEFR